MPPKPSRRQSWKAKISRCLTINASIVSSSRDDFASYSDLVVDPGGHSPFFRKAPKSPPHEDSDSSPIIFLTLEERMIARGFIPRFREVVSSSSMENEDVYCEQDDLWESAREPEGPPPPLLDLIGHSN